MLKLQLHDVVHCLQTVDSLFSELYADVPARAEAQFSNVHQRLKTMLNRLEALRASSECNMQLLDLTMRMEALLRSRLRRDLRFALLSDDEPSERSEPKHLVATEGETER